MKETRDMSTRKGGLAVSLWRDELRRQGQERVGVFSGGSVYVAGAVDIGWHKVVGCMILGQLRPGAGLVPRNADPD